MFKIIVNNERKNSKINLFENQELIDKFKNEGFIETENINYLTKKLSELRNALYEDFDLNNNNTIEFFISNIKKTETENIQFNLKFTISNSNLNNKKEIFYSNKLNVLLLKTSENDFKFVFKDKKDNDIKIDFIFNGEQKTNFLTKFYSEKRYSIDYTLGSKTYLLENVLPYYQYCLSDEEKTKKIETKLDINYLFSFISDDKKNDFNNINNIVIDLDKEEYYYTIEGNDEKNIIENEYLLNFLTYPANVITFIRNKTNNSNLFNLDFSYFVKNNYLNINQINDWNLNFLNTSLFNTKNIFFRRNNVFSLYQNNKDKFFNLNNELHIEFQKSIFETKNNIVIIGVKFDNPDNEVLEEKTLFLIDNDNKIEIYDSTLLDYSILNQKEFINFDGKGYINEVLTSDLKMLFPTKPLFKVISYEDFDSLINENRKLGRFNYIESSDLFYHNDKGYKKFYEKVSLNLKNSDKNKTINFSF